MKRRGITLIGVHIRQIIGCWGALSLRWRASACGLSGGDAQPKGESPRVERYSGAGRSFGDDTQPAAQVDDTPMNVATWTPTNGRRYRAKRTTNGSERSGRMTLIQGILLV